ADSQPACEGQADEEEAQDGDDHRAAGKQDGSAGAEDRVHRGVFGLQTGVEPFAVAGDDEQRIVDADTDADHGYRLVREARHREAVGHQTHDRDAGSHAEDSRHDRQAHGQHRPNAISRMIMAATKPTASLESSARSAKMLPPSSISVPGMSARSTRARASSPTCVYWSLSRSARLTS